MSRYAKAVSALLGAIATWGITAVADDAVSGVEWFGLLGALATVFATWAIPNDPPAGEPPDPDISERGASDLAVICVAVLAVIVVLVLVGRL